MDRMVPQEFSSQEGQSCLGRVEVMNPNLEKIAKHLRNAEEFLRSRRYSEALLEIDYVFQIDSKSYQGRTLQDRIHLLQKKDEGVPLNQAIEPLTKEGIFEHIRIADYHLRAGRYADAFIETDRILKQDPGNYQARSLSERIHAFQKKADEATQQRTQTHEQDLDNKIQAIAQHLKEADRLIALKQYRRALEQVAQVTALDPTNHLAQAYSESIESLMNTDAQPVSKTVTPPPKQTIAPPLPLSPPAPPKEKILPVETLEEAVGRLLMYREILNEMLFDGILNDKEIAELEKVRGLFNITDEQHAHLENEIKIEAYVDALRVVLHDGLISENEERVLELMRKRYGVTMEQHKDAEAKIVEAKRSPPVHGTILVVDDEKTILLTYAAILRRYGYTVLTAETVEDAMTILEKQTPSLILSDIMFPSPDQGGFEFYNQVRNIKRFDNVPFLLMSGVSDEYIIRAGIRLGIDAYLVKPFGNELLLATIEGKLKG
jgi:CheY-like chemotaxis protein